MVIIFCVTGTVNETHRAEEDLKPSLYEPPHYTQSINNKITAQDVEALMVLNIEA